MDSITEGHTHSNPNVFVVTKNRPLEMRVGGDKRFREHNLSFHWHEENKLSKPTLGWKIQ